MKTVSSWDVGGGDQFAFEREGLPSFGCMQDSIEYESRTHHSTGGFTVQNHLSRKFCLVSGRGGREICKMIEGPAMAA